jgi:iron complex transport system substrate-binding protein
VRIASLLPSATEICCALGLGPQIVAVTHECDFPPEMRNRPAVVHSVLDTGSMTSREIDARVEDAFRQGDPLYRIDASALFDLGPDLVITQDLCDVCALPGLDANAVAAALPGPPRVLRLHPHTLGDILNDVLTVGSATHREAEAERLVAQLRDRISTIEAAVRGRDRVPVLCMEWLDPPYCGGHWMPELVALAGGRDIIGRPGRPSFRIAWSDIAAGCPDVIVLALCGFDVARTGAEVRTIAGRSEWRTLPAVAAGRVYSTDASSYFSRSGPRIVVGLQILAAILHPEIAFPPAPPGSWAPLLMPGSRLSSGLDHTAQTSHEMGETSGFGAVIQPAREMREAPRGARRAIGGEEEPDG